MQFFSTHEQEVIKILRTKQVLWSEAGKLAVPIHLIYAREKYRCSDGNLLFDSAGDKEASLSLKYPDADCLLFQKLGLRMMTSTMFVAKLEGFDEQGEFAKKPASWHAELARIAMTAVNQAELSGIKLIPLRSGEWASPAEGPVYFDNEISPLPNVLGIRTVDSKATSHPVRRQFFTWLGVGQLAQQEACRLIVETHQNWTASEASANLSSLPAHALYLYKANHTASVNMLWLYDDARVPRRDKELYIVVGTTDGTNTAGVFQFLRRYLPANEVPMLHTDFMAGTNGVNPKPWLAWKIREVGISPIPHIVKSGRLSTEFKCIVQHWSTNNWLASLKRHWYTYCRELQSLQSSKSAVGELSEMEVFVDIEDKSAGGAKHSLKGTVLPCLKKSHGSRICPFYVYQNPMTPSRISYVSSMLLPNPVWTCLWLLSRPSARTLLLR